MAAITDQQRQFAIDLIKELRGRICRCGSDKKSGFTFCYACFKYLPPDKQKALYRRMGNGYEEAYSAAVGHLQEKGILRRT